MKITLTNESIRVDGWHKSKFAANLKEITDVRVMADAAVPKKVWSRFKNAFGGVKLEAAPRVIIVWAGDKGVTLDAYHDDGFEAALEWFSRNGWNMQAAIARAVRTPLVRVVVEKEQ